MALADFIQSLQEQDTIYSTPPQPSIRVIPPENQSIKVIPPETLATENVPKVIKLKIKPKTEQQPIVENVINTTVNNTPIIETPVTHNILQPVNKNNDTSNKNEHIQSYVQQEAPKPQPKPQPVTPKPEPKPVEKTQITADDIFNSTGTEYSKKQLWLEYYEKARASRKSNPIVDRMRVGRFTITPDNKVLLLPDYDIVGKDPDDVLKDKWF